MVKSSGSWHRAVFRRAMWAPWGWSTAEVPERFRNAPLRAEASVQECRVLPEAPRAWRTGSATLRDGEIGAIDVRVMRGEVLLRMAELEVGESLALGPGESLQLEGVSRVVELAVERNLAWVGLVLALLLGAVGVILYFVVVTVDSAVWVEGDRLVVAVRPHRFIGRFGTRLERLRKEWLS